MKMIKNDVQELNTEELGNAAGGDIGKDLLCWLNGHNWKLDVTIMASDENGIQVDFKHYFCPKCGRDWYEKYNWGTHKSTKITKKEYDNQIP